MPYSLHETNLHAGVHEQHDADVIHADMHPPVFDHWEQPKPLDAPPPRDGYVQRWVRIEFATHPDATNWQNRFREGWKPRLLESIPEDHRNYPTMKHASMGDVIMVGGLVLCEMPIALARRRDAAIRRRIDALEEAVSVETDKASREGAAAGMTGFKPITRDESVKTSMRPPIQTDD